MKKIGLFWLLVFGFVSVGAQELGDLELNVVTPDFEIEEIVPVMKVPNQVALGESIIYDAQDSKLISRSSYGNPSYSWDFGDGSRPKFGAQVKHEFSEPGLYEVRLNVKQGLEKERIIKDVLAYGSKAVLLSDKIETLQELDKEAAAEGIWLKTILVADNGSEVSLEDAFIQKLQENLEFLVDSEMIIFHTRSSIGIQSFAQFYQRLSFDKKFDLQSKLLVQVSGGSLSKIAKLTQPAFDLLLPEFILLTRLEAVNPLFMQSDLNLVESLLRDRGIEFLTVDKSSRGTWLLPLSRLVNFFVKNGISQSVIYLLMAVPFLAFVISFFRQFIGMTTFGVFAPLMLSLSFLVLGLQFGFIAFLVVLLVSYLIRMVFERVELLYIPKISLLLSFLSLSFMLVLGLAIYTQAPLDLSLTIFPMMVMATFSEKFLSAQSSEGLKSALLATAETVFVALVAYLFVNGDFIRNNVLAVAELVFIPIALNVWLGKFTGLRVSEYLKFRSLFGEDSQE